MIEKITNEGFLINECRMEGERKKDSVAVNRTNGLQLSRDRWLLLFNTHGFRGSDDCRSVHYQLREGRPDGRIITERVLSPSLENWDPFHDNSSLLKENDHAVAFGVPKGALIAGKAVPHANHFAALWRIMGKVLTPTGYASYDPELIKRTMDIEWLQFRLNDAEDDIEIIEPPRRLRQVGHRDDETFFEEDGKGWTGRMNQAFVAPVPLNADASQWVCCNHFHSNQPEDFWQLRAIGFHFNNASQRYEWCETGATLGDPRWDLDESSTVRMPDGTFIIAARSRHPDFHIAWQRTDDPFSPVESMAYPNHPQPIGAPLSAYLCADGVLRLVTSEVARSKYFRHRDPLFLYDIDPDTFEPTACRQIFSVYEENIPLYFPKLDFGMLLPHAGGREQYLTFRLFIDNWFKERRSGRAMPAARPEDIAFCGSYYAKFVYDEPCPAAWQFA